MRSLGVKTSAEARDPRIWHADTVVGMEVAASGASLSRMIARAIEALWPELPGLFGERWPCVEYKVASMLQRAVAQAECSRTCQGGEWREAEVELLYSLFDLFSISPRASSRLAEALYSFSSPRGHSNSEGESKEGLNPRAANKKAQAGANPHC